MFVHCNGGISLGPSVVVGYVMARQQTTYEEALKWVQSRRYCISPNQVSQLLIKMISVLASVRSDDVV